MKKFLYFLLPAVLLFNACSQSNSNPNNNNTGCNVTPIPSVYIEINFNGMTHRLEGVNWDGLFFTPLSNILPVTADSPYIQRLQITGGYGTCTLDGSYFGGKDNFSLWAFKIGNATIGNYSNATNSLNLDTKSGGSVSCLHNSPIPKLFTIDSTLSINVSNITNDLITGTFTCNVYDATTVYPATVSFNVRTHP